ncbi:MAG: Fic family protein [Bacilli bacterium]
MIKHSIRYFNNQPVRAVWDHDKSQWWYSAVDLTKVLLDSSDARRYWNMFKMRHPELTSFCGQLKLYAADNKKYLSDVMNEEGVRLFVTIMPSKHKLAVQNWLTGMLDPLDEQSKRKAYEVFKSNLIQDDEIGKTISLLKIHAFLFEGLYPFAGKIRTKTISKGGFVFANGDFLPQILGEIEKMPQSTFDEIVNKYIEMNVAHPFMEGNGRATRIWVDLIFKKELSVCVDWSKIEKKEYLDAMTLSPNSDEDIKRILKNALTDEIDNRELFLKGVDTSYYYEEIE